MARLGGLLADELAAIVLQVVRGRQSHFNYVTPFDTAVFQTMAAMIVTLWVANLVAGVLFLRQPLSARSTSWAIRTGTLISLAGMAVAFFMPRPTPDQMARLEAGRQAGVIGAHTVGARDDGPGLPITGWSTVAGGLQVLVLLAMLLTALAGRYALLRCEAVRSRLVLLAAGGYAGALALVTWQALRGQSVVQPDTLTVALAAVLAIVTAAGLALVLAAARRRVAVTQSATVTGVVG